MVCVFFIIIVPLHVSTISGVRATQFVFRVRVYMDGNVSWGTGSNANGMGKRLRLGSRKEDLRTSLSHCQGLSESQQA